MALCIVAFLPGKLLHKYLESFIRKNSLITNCPYNAYIEWCAERLRTPRVTDRKLVKQFQICQLIGLGLINSLIGFFLCGVAPVDGGSGGSAAVEQRRQPRLFPGWKEQVRRYL